MTDPGMELRVNSNSRIGLVELLAESIKKDIRTGTKENG
jgi:hypothetical protein